MTAVSPAALSLFDQPDGFRQALEMKVLPALMDKAPIFWPGFDRLRRGESKHLIPRHLEKHGFLEIVHIVNGSGRVFFDEEWCIAHIGDTFILPSSIQHDFSSHVTADYDALWICFFQQEDQLHFQERKELLMHYRPHLQLSRSTAMQRTLDNLLHRIQSNSRQLELYLWTTAIQLVADMIDVMDINRSTEPDNQNIEISRSYHMAIMKVLYILRRDLQGDMDLDSLASSVGFTKSYLCTLFKRVTGETIFGCLRRLRMQRAKELLLHNHLSLKETAAAVGYRNLSSFTRAFREFHSYAPSELHSGAGKTP